MTGDELRKKFLSFFVERGHRRLPSSSLVPVNDPTLLFTNAGMVQFKDTFLGLEARPYRRATTVQKCVRAGGKHNDLDVVGRTARHHTFFEMLGNFSFGDYFKREAIAYAWEFLTRELELPRQSLWVTIYEDDEEAFHLWQQIAGLAPERIIRMGEKDNFWAMGETGPCGPCSEIIYDRGEAHRCTAERCGIGSCDCDRWLEIWNLVFMQYMRDEAGQLSPLPRPSIDTGMGLERMASVLQNVDSNFDTDLIRPIIEGVEEITGKTYDRGEKGFPFRVIADHVRASTFLVADGVLPSNEGRGYVLRRIIRRAVRFGRLLHVEKPFLFRLVPIVVGIMGEAYPEIVEQKDSIQDLIRYEEERFHETLDEGMRVATSMIQRAQAEGQEQLGGDDAFLLYDTYGFPIDLTEELALESGLKLDRYGFERAMQRQKERSRSSREDSRMWDDLLALSHLLESVPATQFVGYDSLEASSQVLAFIKDGERTEKLSCGQEGYMVATRSPFYGEGGGQVGDTGVVMGEDGRARVTDTQKLPNGIILHLIRVTDGSLSARQVVQLRVDVARRLSVARNHSATHLLHQALKEVLGRHANQAGSLVNADRLRFDFTHFASLDAEQLAQIEERVNQEIEANLPVQVFMCSFDEAEALGAMALFKEKYQETVRVVKIGDYSIELCGGTHVNSTGEIGLFKIVHEESVGSGIRRVEALTAGVARQYLRHRENLLEKAALTLKVEPDMVADRVEGLVQDLKSKQDQLSNMQRKLLELQAGGLAKSARQVGPVSLVAATVGPLETEYLRTLADLVRDQLDSGLVILASPADGKAALVAMLTKDLVQRGLHAGRLIGEIARAMGGKGGGRPDMAQAGAKDISRLDQALELIPGLIENTLR